MTNEKFYRNLPYLGRVQISGNLYIEIMDIRIRKERIECMSRFHDSELGAFSYRWRKICGKGVFVPYLERPAKDDHCWSLSFHNPVTGKQTRAYLRDFKKE